MWTKPRTNPGAFADKIRAGKEAQATQEFMVVARIESLILGKGVSDTLGAGQCLIVMLVRTRS
jgi:2-methylisocitrate lyase-like PEP mutase family enzyme